MWTRWILLFCFTLKLEKQKICVTSERKNQIWDLSLFISVRCVSPALHCLPALVCFKAKLNSYRFTFKRNNCTKASVTPTSFSLSANAKGCVKNKSSTKKKKQNVDTVLGGGKSMPPAKICVLLESWIAFKQ